MLPQWANLLPPVFVIVTALCTRSFNSALSSGIIVTALLAGQGSLSVALSLIRERCVQQLFNFDSFCLYLFLIAIGAIVVLLTTTGCIDNFAKTARNYINNARHMQYGSLLASLLLALDDYLSILTVGHIMTPLGQQFAVARAKLAYLVHAFAGSLVILIPISSWMAAIVGYLNQSGIDIRSDAMIVADPFFIYLRSIPFMFYSLFNLFTVMCIVHKDISFGSMYQAEQETARDVVPQPMHTAVVPNNVLPWKTVLIPFVILFAGVLLGILYYGDAALFGGTNSIFEAFKNNQQIFLVLAQAGIAALIVLVTSLYLQKRIFLSQVPQFVLGGFNLMKNAMIMVFLASTLSLMIRTDLATGHYLGLLLHKAPVEILPLLFFMVSLATALATGSAWGTSSLMFSIAIPMLVSLTSLSAAADPASIPLLYVVVGAIISGSVCGDHISPFSETTVMTAASTHTDPFTHCVTQLPYALVPIAASIFAFIAYSMMKMHGLGMAYFVALFGGLIFCFIVLTALNKKRAISIRT
jgi:tetracycline resistance efflux pump